MPWAMPMAMMVLLVGVRVGDDGLCRRASYKDPLGMYSVTIE